MSRPTVAEDSRCKQQNISMRPEQLKRVSAYCQKHDRSISWVIRNALDEYLINHK